jgi:cytochrome c biogenesis protein CcdA
MNEAMLRRRARVRFGAVAVGLLVAGLAGYVGFVAVADGDRSSSSAIMALAAAAGFAAFFSPCSFPLLLTFLTRRADESIGAAAVTAIRVGLGAATLLAAIAAVTAVAGDAAATALGFDRPAGRVFRVAIGSGLIIFGLRQARLIRMRMRWLDRVAGRAAAIFDTSQSSGRSRSDFVYGFGYLLAGFG